MSTVLLDTTDLGEAEELLSANFTSTRIGSMSRRAATRTRLLRSSVGSLAVDDLEFSYDLRYEMEPPDRISLFRVRWGSIESRASRGGSWDFAAGDVGVCGATVGRPVTGHVRQARYDIMLIDRSLFDRVAAGPAERDTEPVRLTGEKPMSPAAGRHMARAIDYVVRDVTARSDLPQDPLIATAVQQYLATTMLATFPNTAVLEPTIEDRHDTTPILLRRAITFIDDNADRDISLADIANHIYVTPRSVQLMFRKHRDSTPMEYLRRVRLHHAHAELLRSDRMRTTVTQIAAKWGFAHTGRFAVSYREVYGRSPHVTLRESP